MKNPSAHPAPGQALAALEAHLRQRPDDVEALTDAAILLEASGGAPQAALARYDEALRLAPGHFRARLNRAALMAMLGRLEEALQDNLQLTKRYVGSWAAFYNLADVLLRLDRYADALAAADRALRLAPEKAETLMLRGLALAMLARDEEARAAFEQAQRTDAAAAGNYRAAAAAAAGVAVPQRLTLDPRQIRLARLLERQKTCDWRERGRLIAGMQALAADLRRAPAPLEEMGLYHTALSLPLTASEQQALARGIAMAAEARAAALPRNSAAADGRDLRAHKKIRLGFITPNFREHPSAKLHWRHLALRDRTRFEVYGYSLRPGEGPLIIGSDGNYIKIALFADQNSGFGCMQLVVQQTGRIRAVHPDTKTPWAQEINGSSWLSLIFYQLPVPGRILSFSAYPVQKNRHSIYEDHSYVETLLNQRILKRRPDLVVDPYRFDFPELPE